MTRAPVPMVFLAATSTASLMSTAQTSPRNELRSMHGAQYHNLHPKPFCLEKTPQCAETCSPGNYFPTLDTFPKKRVHSKPKLLAVFNCSVWLRSITSFELPGEPDFVFGSRRGIPLTTGNFSEQAIQTREFCESLLKTSYSCRRDIPGLSKGRLAWVCLVACLLGTAQNRLPFQVDRVRRSPARTEDGRLRSP